MPLKYLAVINTIKSVNKLELIDEFVKAEGEKYIVIKDVKVFNNTGQIDVGMFLCGTFGDDSIKSCGLIDDFIASTSITRDKYIHVNNNDSRITFYFKDYKGTTIEEKSDYYYLIDLLLIWGEKDNVIKALEQLNE